MGFDLVAAVDWSYLSGLAITIFKVAAGLGFVIFVHELGHFLVAKACGVKCEKFYIGFDIPMPFGLPSRFCRFQWGETEYGVGILPLGGYVKMLGQDDNPMRAEEEAERTRVATSADKSTEAAVPVVAAASAAVAGAPTPHQPDSALGQRQYELDPRSYTAKAVWQRMLIISAGVIMNLIFAVIFAACAYRVGVPFTPCEIGQVVPGGPAWKAGVEPGSRLIQIGEQGTKRETLRFDFDLRQSVATHGDKSELALLFRDSEGNESWKRVRPFTSHRTWLESYSTIGVTPAPTNVLVRTRPVIDHTAAANASPPLEGGDAIVGADGNSFASPYQIIEYLAQNPEKSITLKVERKKKDSDAAATLDVTIPPQRLKDFGIVMHHGPITAIRPNSPAAKAGFQEGDILLEINGEPLEDPMLLPEVIRPFYNQEITVTVKRGGSDEPHAIRVTPLPPRGFDWVMMQGSAMASEALGIGYEVSRRIRTVRPDSPAAAAGLRPDDLVEAIQFRWEDGNEDPTRKKLLSHEEQLTLDDRQVTWPLAFDYVQNMVPGEVVELIYNRQGKMGTARLAPVEIEAFSPQRGLLFQPKSENYIASSWPDAVFLGARQTWEDAFRVVGILKKLITGQVSVANLGGIGSIAYVAGKETEQGTTRLLIFLTMLSANLAVLNFLPIPALDGGHMMFLLYEGIFRKPVNERLQFALTITGVACLLGLMIFVNAMDVHRFFFQ